MIITGFPEDIYMLIFMLGIRLVYIDIQKLMYVIYMYLFVRIQLFICLDVSVEKRFSDICVYYVVRIYGINCAELQM